MKIAFTRTRMGIKHFFNKSNSDEAIFLAMTFYRYIVAANLIDGGDGWVDENVTLVSFICPFSLLIGIFQLLSIPFPRKRAFLLKQAWKEEEETVIIYPSLKFCRRHGIKTLLKWKNNKGSVVSNKIVFLERRTSCSRKEHSKLSVFLMVYINICGISREDILPNPFRRHIISANCLRKRYFNVVNHAEYVSISRHYSWLNTLVLCRCPLILSPSPEKGFAAEAGLKRVWGGCNFFVGRK